MGQPRFDRVVEGLMYRKFRDKAEVAAYDGRGGDGGRDIVVRHRNGRRTIYQLKYYPEGFSGGFVKRRDKIRASFKAALAHNPHAWVLVTPGNLTTSEEAFVKNLSKKHPAAKVRVQQPWGRAALDAELSEFPNYLHAVICEPLVEKARILQQEQAWLLDPDDLTARVQALGRLADARDANWGVNFERRGTATICTVVPQHPAAPQVSPLGFKLDLADGHHDLAGTVDRSLGYGVLDPVELPRQAVKRLEVTGPAWLATVHEDVAVSLVPTDAEFTRRPVELRFPDGNLVRSAEGALVGAARGHSGRTLRARFHHGVTITCLLPDDGAPVTVHTTFDAHGLHPADVLDCAILLRTFTTTTAFDVMIDGHRLGAFTATETGPDSELDADLRALELLAEDLDIVQRHCRQRFTLPDTLALHERLLLHLARRLLDGDSVDDPQPRTVSIELNGRRDAPLDKILAGEAQALTVTAGSWPLTVAGRTLDIGPVWLYHPEVRGALDPDPRPPTESLAGRVLRFTPVRGLFTLYKPSAISEASPP